jgi:hypothetical protein
MALFYNETISLNFINVQNFCPFVCNHHSAYTVFDKIDQVQAIWSKLLPVGHHLSVEQLRIFEITNPEAIQFRYLIMQDAQLNPIGCVYLQLLKFNASHYNHAILNKPKLAPIKNYLLKQDTDILICGNLFRMNFQGFYFPNSSNKDLLLPVLKHYVSQNSDKLKFSSIFLKDCMEGLSVKVLKDNRFKAAPKDIAMQISLRENWHSFDDYKADLSRKYLQRATKIKTAKSPLTVKELSLQDIVDNASRIEFLYHQVADKQDVKMGILNAQYFVSMKETLQANFSVMGYFLDTELVAFSSYIFDNKAMEIHYIGIDYAYNDRHKIYFNILFDGLEMAMLHDKPTIALGRTTKEAKASAGASPIFINNYIWIKFGLPTLAFNFFYKWYSSQTNDAWKNRNPFKTIVA